MADRIERSEIERQVIGSLILNNGVGSSDSGLAPEDFLFGRHAEMFAALQVQETEKILASSDAVSLWQSSGVPATVWADVMGSVLSAANLKFWVAELKKVVLEAAEERERKALAQEVQAGGDPFLAATTLEGRMEALRSRYGDEARQSRSSRAVQELMQQIWDRKPPKMAVKTDIAPLDRLCYRLCAGDYVVLAARPSVGKSALALNIAKNLAERGDRVCFISLEMDAKQLFGRLLGGYSGVDTRRAMLAPEELSDYEQEKLVLGFEPMMRTAKMLDIHDEVGLDIKGIARIATAAVRNGAKLVILDYIQLLDREGSDSRAERLAKISREWKALMRGLGVPGLILSQLSRDCEKAGRRPNLSDLRDSGGLEQDADIVWFLHRDYNDRSSKIREFIQAKGRNQGVGETTLFYDLQSQTFAEAVDVDGLPFKRTPPQKRSGHDAGDPEDD